MCCLFGMVDYKRSLTPMQKSRMMSILARECETKGTDATGIAYNAGKRLRIYKRPLPARYMHFMLPKDTRVVMGHTRMTTQGSEKKTATIILFLAVQEILHSPWRIMAYCTMMRF